MRLRELRENEGLTQEQLGKELNVGKNTISRYETGEREVGNEMLLRLAARFNVSTDYLLGRTDDRLPPTTLDDLIERIGGYRVDEWVRIPILGEVRAGVGGFAYESFEGFEPISADSISGDVEDYFMLRVVGDSMYPRFFPGDLLLVRKQTSVDSGALAVVIVDDEEGVVKRVKYGSDWIQLLSENPAYEPRVFAGADVQRVYVVGLVVKLIRNNV